MNASTTATIIEDGIDVLGGLLVEVLPTIFVITFSIVGLLMLLRWVFRFISTR